MGRRGRRRKQLLDYLKGNERILQIEIGSTGWHLVGRGKDRRDGKTRKKT